MSPLLVLVAALHGCVTVDIDPTPGGLPPASPVVIPLVGAGGSAERNPLTEYYRSVLRQMQDAVVDGEPAYLRGLCVQHDRVGAPEWARTQIATYRKCADVLDAEQYLEREGLVAIRDGESPALGQRVPLVWSVPVGQPTAVRLPAKTTRVLIEFEAIDHDCLGGRVLRKSSRILPLSTDVTVGEDAVDFPFDLEALPAEGAWRELNIRATLLPGHVELATDGSPMPNSRRVCGEARVEIFPLGVEPVREQPMKTLRNALASGRTEHLSHVCLATRFMPEGERAAAAELLVDRVRLGHRVQSRACMAALRELTGETISVDDREGWLRWWSARAGAEAESR